MLRQYDIVNNQNTELVKEFQDAKKKHEEIVGGFQAKILRLSANTNNIVENIAEADLIIEESTPSDLESRIAIMEGESASLMSLISGSSLHEFSSLREGVNILILSSSRSEAANSRLVKSEEDKNRLETELAVLKIELGVTNTKLADEEVLRAESESAKTELVQRHENARVEFKKVWGDLQTRLDESIACNEVLESEIKQGREAIKERDSAVEDTLVRLNKAETCNKRLESELLEGMELVKKSDAEVADVQKIVLDKEARIVELDFKIFELENSVSGYFKKTEKMDGQTEIERKRHMNLEQEFIMLEMDKTRLEKTLAAVEAARKELVDDGGKKFDDLEREVKALTADYEGLLDAKRGVDVRVETLEKLEKKHLFLMDEKADLVDEVKKLREVVPVGDSHLAYGYTSMVWLYISNGRFLLRSGLL
jgi:chromosome segregation ATPase